MDHGGDAEEVISPGSAHSHITRLRRHHNTLFHHITLQYHHPAGAGLEPNFNHFNLIDATYKYQHSTISPEPYAPISKSDMPSTRMRIRNANRTQTHRRQVYSNRNAATLARLQRQAEVGRQREQAAQPPHIGNLFDPNHDYPFDAQQESADRNQAEDESEWGNFSEEEPDEVDLAMASYKEKYRQQAREYNWNILLRQLQGEYMKLKVTTKNWAGPNSYNNYASCSPTCSKRYNRPVDLVDIHAFWLRRKFALAVRRRRETRRTLNLVLSKRNPHDQEGRNYTVQFFREQWAAQRSFQGDHTEEEQTRRAKLVSLYKREETLELMRARLQSPEIFLESPDQVRQLMDSIVEQSEILRRETEDIAGSSAVETGDPEEQKLRLLLWDAKAELFVQAVHLNAERQPLINSMGSRLGTRGKEKIIKAMQSRRPAVKKVIDAFNQLYTKYKAKYPNQQLYDAEDHPLTYKAFSKWPMDHRFWNDGLYYHSSAPWSVDPDVRTGINCVLILQRTREEFELIAQELARAKGWAVAHHARIKTTINYISSRKFPPQPIAGLRFLMIGRSQTSLTGIHQLQNNPNLDTDYVDNIMLGDLTREAKMKVICEELKLQLKAHEELVSDWSEDLVWLWSRCQPVNNQHLISEWHALIQQIEQLESQTVPTPDIDENLEDAVLDVNVEDGEDAEDELLSDAEL
ncbi:hypothetical protein PtA15_7A740 [Puccinia triticina]|uniref:CxC1-like cysteine cluster associated with KDZ transposases domain-containing protein n=1 Tax=Puccinia triticina TaxID=208348 RepID=A0ABY7CSC2_9BASI|nr:uncharacterized protein PtA15_7A740 [Puccinia triticina]WAQ87011.1 hypothetical protein PtA15_7A740 [Puccinia triticina]